VNRSRENGGTPAVPPFRRNGLIPYDPAMMPDRPPRFRVRSRLTLLILLLAVLAICRPSPSAPQVPHALEPATQSTSPATTRSAPATTQAASEKIPELNAAFDRLGNWLAADGAGGRPAAATERAKVAWHVLMTLTAATNGLNEGKYEQGLEAAAERDKKLDEQFAKFRAEHAGDGGAAVRAEIDAVEHLTREAAHSYDFVNRPSKFASDREAQLDLARRVDQIPRFYDRLEPLSKDLDYHNKRLALLVEMAELRTAAAKPGVAAQAARQKLAADTALLAAKDRAYEAQLAADRIKVPTTSPTTRDAAGQN
jgi:hypothetical protein